MLSEYEQRVLEELEHSCRMQASDSVPSGRPPGIRTLIVLGCASVGLLVAGVPAAALAVATATVIGWVFWRLWSRRADGGPIRRPVGASIRDFLTWLSEAE